MTNGFTIVTKFINNIVCLFPKDYHDKRVSQIQNIKKVLYPIPEYFCIVKMAHYG